MKINQTHLKTGKYNSFYLYTEHVEKWVILEQDVQIIIAEHNGVSISEKQLAEDK